MAQDILFPSLRTVGSSMGQGLETAYNREKNLETEQMRYDMQTASKMKLAELMSSLKSKQKFAEAQQNEPYFTKQFGEDQGKFLARQHPTIQREYIKDLLNRQGYNELQQGEQQRGNIPNRMQALGQPAQFTGVPVNQQPLIGNQPFTRPIAPSPIAPPGMRADLYSKNYPQLQKKYATDLKDFQYQQKREDALKEHEEARAFETQKDVKKYLATESRNAQIYQKEKNDLSRVYDLFQSFKNKYPQAWTTHMSSLFESYINQDKDIREADALLKKYAVYESSIEGIGAGKGSKYRTELIRESKPNYQMPGPAFENALKGAINHTSDELDKFNYITRQKDPKTKRYPADIDVLAASYQLAKSDPELAKQMAQEDPISFPELFDVGDKIENDDGSHDIVKIVNGIKKWARM